MFFPRRNDEITLPNGETSVASVSTGPVEVVDIPGAMFESGKHDQAFAFKVAAGWLGRHPDHRLLDVVVDKMSLVMYLRLIVIAPAEDNPDA